MPIKFDESEPKGIRKWLYDRDIYSVWDVIPFSYHFKFWYYDHVRPIFRPANKRIRKAVPRTGADITSLIETLNFEMIKAFYEDEYLADIVDWTATDGHQAFATWLEGAYQYVTVERVDLQQQLTNTYPDINFGDYLKIDKDPKQRYQDLYGEVNRLEKLIDERDSQVLTELIKFRHYMWT